MTDDDSETTGYKIEYRTPRTDETWSQVKTELVECDEIKITGGMLRCIADGKDVSGFQADSVVSYEQVDKETLEARDRIFSYLAEKIDGDPDES